MDIIKQAIQIEEEGERLYRDFAEKSQGSGLKKIFNFLADAELEHKKVFQNIGSNAAIDIQDSNILEEAKKIFIKMGEKSSHVSMENYEMSVYREALSVEQKSIDFYTEIMEKVEDSRQETISKILNEEKKHYRLMENIIEFVNRPQSWLEDAEWNHFEEY